MALQSTQSTWLTVVMTNDYELSAYSFRLFPPHLVSFSFVLNISLSLYKGGRIGALASTLIYKTLGLLVSDFPELQDMVL